MVYVLLAKATSIGHSLETDHASAAPTCERASIEGHRTCPASLVKAQYRSRHQRQSGR